MFKPPVYIQRVLFNFKKYASFETFLYRTISTCFLLGEAVHSSKVHITTLPYLSVFNSIINLS
jgi:hypothetical protein